MDRKLIIERIRYWTNRRCYRHAAVWRQLLLDLAERSDLVLLDTGLAREPRTNTLNNGGR